jgi:hypothetical protein
MTAGTTNRMFIVAICLYVVGTFMFLAGFGGLTLWNFTSFDIEGTGLVLLTIGIFLDFLSNYHTVTCPKCGYHGDS